MSIPLFAPPTPQQSFDFMDRVKPTSPTLRQTLGETCKRIWGATRSSIGTLLSAPSAAIEKTAHLTANVLATPSTLLFKLGGIMGKTRAKTYSVLAGKAA